MKHFFLTAILLVSTFVCINAKKFYGSKSQIIGISGSVRELVAEGFSAKYFNNEIQLPAEAYLGKGKYDKKKLLAAFSREGTGKKILDLLFQYNGHSLSEDLLKDRAMQNVQLMDEERARIGVVDKETILREDYLQILQNNYIFLTRSVNIGKSFGQMLIANQLKNEHINYEGKSDRYRTYWIVFKVNIDKGTLDQVFKSWNDMNLYNQINVPIEYVASGSFKENDAKLTEVRNLLLKSVSKKVEAFAIHGQVTDNHPLTTNIGSKQGVQQGDRLNIYRQVTNGEGQLSSIRVASARAGIVNNEKSRLYAISGSATSYKQGDIAVLRMDRGIGHSISYNMLNMGYDEKLHGVSYTFDKRLYFNKFGISTYLLTTIGVMFNKADSPDVKINDGIEYDEAPMFLDPGIGIGFGKTLFSRVEIMPYARVHYMFGLGDEDDYDDFSEAIKVPVGIKFNINLFYPLQLSLSAKYNFMFAKDGDTWGDSDGGMYKAWGISAGLRLAF